MIGAMRRNRANAIPASSYIKYGVDFDGNVMSICAQCGPMCWPPRQPSAHQRFKMGALWGGNRQFRGDARVNHATIYRKTIAYFADQLLGR